MQLVIKGAPVLGVFSLPLFCCTVWLCYCVQDKMMTSSAGDDVTADEFPLCPPPSHLIFQSPALLGCAQVALGQVVNISSATWLCWDTFSFTGGASVTLYTGNYFDVTLVETQALLANNPNYTEDLLVAAEWSDDAWCWADGSPVPPAASSPTLPDGGTGPDDYSLLYLRADDGFLLHAAKEGRGFGGTLCQLVTSLM